MQPKINNVTLSLEDLLGQDYVEAACEAEAWLAGGSTADYLAVAQERVDFFPNEFREHLDALLDDVGRPVISGLPGSSEGAPSAAFRRAANRAAAPVGALGFYRIGEDGRLYLTTKSEHYHASLGHNFPGYRLLQRAQRLGITNVTHNNTRGHVTRLLERELVRTANGLPKGDEAALDRTVTGNEPHVLNRVINLETGSLAVEAALKMMLRRFYRLHDTDPQPEYAGRTPVFIVIADKAGGTKANYHGTTILTQLLRGMWPDLAAGMADRGLYRVQPVKINDLDDFQAVLRQWETPPYKVAGFFHEIVMMNYGAIRLTPEYLRGAYDLCHGADVPIIADEIQSCAWSPGLFLFREYGLNPDFVSLGKGFPGGQYPASRMLFSGRYDALDQFGALVTNGQEELASLSYLVTMAFIEANGDYIAALGDYYWDKLEELAAEFPRQIEKAEGHRHLGSLFFHRADDAVACMKAMNRAGYDVSAQTYKADCPPALLTKVPLISSYNMVDRFTAAMIHALSELEA